MKKRMAALLAGAFMAFSAHTPMAQAGFLGDLLFAPTYDPTKVPETYGTKYDCRAFTAAGKTGWKGIVSGRINDFEHVIVRSRAGCFETRQECQTFITYMQGYFDFTTYAGCDPFPRR